MGMAGSFQVQVQVQVSSFKFQVSKPAYQHGWFFSSLYSEKLFSNTL